MKRSAKAGYILFCLVFAAVSVIPSAGMFFGNRSENTAEGEQRPVFPSVRNEEGKINKDWNSQTDSYLSENFAFREEMIKANTFLRKELAGVSASDQIIIGKDDWLYYSQTADDFFRDPDISDREIANIVRNLGITDRYVSENGGQLLVTVAPNKNTVYPEYMPDNYIASKAMGNIDRLSEALKKTDIKYLDLKKLLTEEKERTGVQLYHKRDTHWNSTGALAAVNGMLDMLNVPHSDLSDVPYKTVKNWDGDLDRMLWPGRNLKDFQNEYEKEFNYTTTGRYRGTDDLVINTVNDQAEKSMMMFRDSFGAAVIPFLSENFSEAVYLRARPYQLYYMEKKKYDCVILEIVERNIDWLETEAPVHAAVTGEKPDLKDVHDCTGRHSISFDNKSYVHIYGTLDLPEGPDSPYICITLTGEDGSESTYQAYNCFEGEVTVDQRKKGNGYSVYIPSEKLNGNYKADITVKLPDGVYLSQAGSFSYSNS